MDADFDISRLLQLRKLTRVVSTQVENDLRDYLKTLAPLFSPHGIFGDYIRGGPKGSVKGAEKAFKKLRDKFQAVARQKPFSLSGDLEPPLDIFSASPVLSPVEYVYQATDGNGKTVAVNVTSPLRWVISYPDMTPNQIKKLLEDNRNQSRDSLRHALLQALALETILELKPGLARIFEGLRYSIAPATLDMLSPLQVIHLSCPLSTQLPPDPVIIQNTEISGIASFEEVIDMEQIENMEDPFKQRIIDIVEAETPELLSDIH